MDLKLNLSTICQQNIYLLLLLINLRELRKKRIIFHNHPVYNMFWILNLCFLVISFKVFHIVLLCYFQNY